MDKLTGTFSGFQEDNHSYIGPDGEEVFPFYIRNRFLSPSQSLVSMPAFSLHRVWASETEMVALSNELSHGGTSREIVAKGAQAQIRHVATPKKATPLACGEEFLAESIVLD